MSIKYAILGYLSWQSYSGYDLKKIFEASSVLHWSGNNNQIYKALIELHEAGMVTLEVEQQVDKPPRKIYTITEQGHADLKRWVLSEPELPQIKHNFLVQLAWADQLDANELEHLMQQYEEEVQVHLLMLQEHKKRAAHLPQRTPRESLLWDEIINNRIGFCENELIWTRNLREKLKALPKEA